MMKRSIQYFFIAVVLLCSCQKANDLPKYLFYQHGAVVTLFGDNAINQSMPEWGPYEYSRILDSLRSRGFQVFSEIRKEGVADSVYANRIIQQIDSLRKRGVDWKQITIVGASAGWHITLLVATQLQNPEMKYVMMGGCWPNTYQDYANYKLKGHFLSIIETTDPHGTCDQIFNGRDSLSSYQEIKLNTGLSHGFIYKGYKAWVDPIVAWTAKKEKVLSN